ncbi:tRNA (adenosine(37)-N6)-threonylcarbamoyltransferase complex ATPase subunit type 1 TsaE [Paenibacillus segetis]|uniref:tRNA threonylcarbamoyladenosine biosynthesis protein TsaE n=1 Tax=Paenibacillus segetis TaxID=1325360 RepID=A0ABQ1Y509_9BACL|nr:tRNA (adenosine(37)-N6)-threonylcarbamoyltransferase complex ATPase subunit type 1 TsaE [Paenibacillus segetis]GGH12749.1 tRNA (adenosine(37)-N6)-threonylcarbamoyltransferase complex ATPase subunit type 1 TsaE [Paenibacillus segetis]
MALDYKASAQFVYEAHDLSGTDKLASFLAEKAGRGTVIALDGDLGAGKTAFAQLFAKHLEVRGTVNSPTFTLIKEYEGRLPFYHMDVYRLSQMEAEELGLDEYFYGDGVTLVEWASLIEDILPPELLHIYVETVTGSQRRMYLHGRGKRYEQWTTILKENGV